MADDLNTDAFWQALRDAACGEEQCCAYTAEELALFAEGRLGGRAGRTMEKHVASCDSCRLVVGELCQEITAAAAEESRLKLEQSAQTAVDLSLSELEVALMRVVWAGRDPLRVEDVSTALEAAGRKLAYTTVMSGLAKLHRKNLLARDMRGRTYHYSAALSEGEFRDSVSRAAFGGMLRSFSRPVLAYFIQVLDDRDPEQIDRLAALLDHQKREDGDQT